MQTGVIAVCKQITYVWNPRLIERILARNGPISNNKTPLFITIMQ